MNESLETASVDRRGPPWQRRLFHASVGSAIPVVAWFVPDPFPAFLVGVLALASLALDLIRFRVPRLNLLFLSWLRPLLKQEEDRRITGATFLLIAACLCFLFFDKHIAVAVLLFLSLGDPAAALVGGAVRGPRLFGKSPVGTLTFILVSLGVLAILAALGVTHFGAVLVAAAVVAGLVELAPLPADDNLTVPLVAGAFAQYLPLLTGP